MEKDILALLSVRSVHFSKRQRAVADYICEHPDMAAFMTAELLARAAGVSESTVVRFALELGFSGYPDMRRAVQQLLRSRIGAEGQNVPGQPETDYSRLLCGTAVEYSKALAALAEGDNPQLFDRAVKQLQRAKRLFLLGEGMGEAAAKQLWQGLRLIRDGVQLVGEEPYGQIFRIGAGDALLYICFKGGANHGPARFAHDSGAAVIALATESMRRELSFADNFIPCGKGSVEDYTSALVAFAVCGAILRAFPEELRAGGKKSEKIRQEYENNDRG